MNWKFFVTLVSLVVQFAFRLPWDHCEGRKADGNRNDRVGRSSGREAAVLGVQIDRNHETHEKGIS